MKQLFITIVLLFSLTGLFAKSNIAYEVKDYVKTETTINYFEKIKHGINNSLIGFTVSGEKVKFDKTDVHAFRKKGKEYKRFYMVEEGSAFVKSIFLERLGTRAGYTIYKKVSRSADNLELSDFYVFYHERLEMQLNEENYKPIFSFFSPYCNLMFNS